MQSIGSNEKKMFEPGHLPIPKHRKRTRGAGETAWQLRVCTPLTEDLSLDPSTDIRCLTSNFRDPQSSSGLHGHVYAHVHILSDK